ncbi:hypothetical protein ACIP5Y_00875 [Nocardia sp. NPDC088792]|uniref:hypothetical protein n=1 Tax=Nocardia sp. NPDC088792 TaxID=3364332 RepID=UPI0038216FF7
MTAPLSDPVSQPGWLASLTPAIAADHTPDTRPAGQEKVHTFNGLTPMSAARKFQRVQNARDLVANVRDTPMQASPIAGPAFGDIYGPTLPPGASSGPVPASVEDMMRQQIDSVPSPKDQQGNPPQPNPQPQNQAPQQAPAPQQPVPQQNPAPQPNAQQPQPDAQQAGVPASDQSSQIPDRIDPAALAAMPSLSTIYNPDGTRKTPQQQATDRTARDMVDLPTALADNQSGTTSLGGGGTIEKTITATTDGWQTNTTVTLANGFTTTFSNNTGTDVEQLPNGRTATTLSYGDAATQARTELGRIQQQMLDPSKPGIPGNPTSVIGSGINDAGDARQLVEALDRLMSNPNAPITVIKDKNGRITSLTVLAADGSEHVLVLNAGGISYDQETQKYFEFYRRPNGMVTTPDGYRIVEIGGEYIRVDDSGAPVLPNNPTAEEARVFGSNGVRTDKPHGPPTLSSPDYGPSPSTPSTASQPDGPLRYPVTPNTTGPFVVELPNGDLASISEIQVPKGVSAQRMYKVEGGGLLVESDTGLHWATDPGLPPTPEETGKAITNAVAETIIWTAAGEGLGYLAVRASARVLPKIAEILARNATAGVGDATTAAVQVTADATAADSTATAAAAGTRGTAARSTVPTIQDGRVAVNTSPSGSPTTPPIGQRQLEPKLITTTPDASSRPPVRPTPGTRPGARPGETPQARPGLKPGGRSPARPGEKPIVRSGDFNEQVSIGSVNPSETAGVHFNRPDDQFTIVANETTVFVNRVSSSGPSDSEFLGNYRWARGHGPREGLNDSVGGGGSPHEPPNGPLSPRGLLPNREPASPPPEIPARRRPEPRRVHDDFHELRRDVIDMHNYVHTFPETVNRTLASAELSGDNITSIQLRAMSGKDSYLDNRRIRIDGSTRAPSEGEGTYQLAALEGGWSGEFDSERKILEELGNKLRSGSLGTLDATSKVRIVVDRPAGDSMPSWKIICDSCKNVIRQFREEFGIDVEVRDMRGRILPYN